MSIYDTILANTQQGYQNLANQQMQMSQMPTFADKFLAGLKEREQMDYQRKMAESNLAMNQAFKQAQEENMRRQRVQDIYGGASKMTLDQAGLNALVQKLGGMGEDTQVASAMLPKPDESGVARGFEAQKSYDANQRKIEHERNLQTLQAAQAELAKAQTDYASARSDSERALLAPKVQLAQSKAKTFESLVNSQIYANYNPVQYGTPVTGVDPDTGNLVLLQPNTRTGGVTPVEGYGAAPKTGASKRTVDPATTLRAIQEARGAIARGSSGAIGTGIANASSFLGVSSDESRANAELGVIAANLTLSVPRMEGAQSEADRKMYERAAADVGNTMKSAEDRLAALDLMEKITQKYSKGGAPNQQPRGAVPTFASPSDPGFSDLKPGDKFYDGNGNLRTR